ncbi:iron-containing redox enzyme family protein [Sorangium sp. So ce834]|uniref:iron-containing redox enzyme family protein n=1 Tax=Sorangium sp. So ce834 TaxID=3133321 RepID=UPI003F5F952F
MDRKERLLELYDLLPFHQHPLWVMVMKGTLSLQQVAAAECQHFLRTRAGQRLRRDAMTEAHAQNARLWEVLLSIYLEECTNEKGTSHLELIRRLCTMCGIADEELERSRPTPGNSASMALYRDIARRGAACHLLGAGAVEHYYCQLSPKIYDAYTTRYQMTDEQAETYRLHGPMDREHADRSFAVLDEVVDIVGWEAIEDSVRDAFVATSLHYDGMLHAATGELSYWNGR